MNYNYIFVCVFYFQFKYSRNFVVVFVCLLRFGVHGGICSWYMQYIYNLDNVTFSHKMYIGGATYALLFQYVI